MSPQTRLPRRERGADLEDITRDLLECGGVVVEGMLDDELIGRLNAEIDPFVADADPAMKHLNPAIGAFFGDRTRHVAGLASKSPTFASEVLCHPVLLGVCDRVLSPSCASYQLNVGHVLDRGPGADAQWLHRDELVWVHVPRPHPELQVASMTALVDFSEELGATRLVPGSHRWPLEREARPEEVVVAEMPAGSSVIYLGSTIHGAGANRTQRSRRGLHLSYVLGWLRTEENNYLATPPAVARTLPRRAQELLGYAVHDALRSAGGYLGMVGLRDPLDLLDEGGLG
jgi:ectoine hydroxylase-related dioxygenase (phytanoyl-CoA dioxygenase family)